MWKVLFLGSVLMWIFIYLLIYFGRIYSFSQFMNKKALEIRLQFVGQGGPFSLPWITSSTLWCIIFLDPKFSYRS